MVEVKKVANRDFSADIWKLKGMTEQVGNCGYSVDVYFVIDVSAGLASQCDVYVDAEQVEELTEWMRVALTGAR